MALEIYRNKEELPKDVKYVNVNDVYFDLYTGIQESDFTKRVLQHVDMAKYDTDKTVKTRTEGLGAMYKSVLSTGCKTILNIIEHPDVCFDVLECGVNALDFIPELESGKIVWEYPQELATDKVSCNIYYRNKVYNDYYEFLEAIKEESLGE